MSRAVPAASAENNHPSPLRLACISDVDLVAFAHSSSGKRHEIENVCGFAIHRVVSDQLTCCSPYKMLLTGS
jgi:hypothetical protein